MFIWLGKGASDREKIGAEEAVEAISNKAEGINKVTVKEGEEDDTFWYVSSIIYGVVEMEPPWWRSSGHWNHCSSQ